MAQTEEREVESAKSDIVVVGLLHSRDDTSDEVVFLSLSAATLLDGMSPSVAWSTEKGTRRSNGEEEE